MGIKIFFKGKLENTDKINNLKDELIDISNIMKWKYLVLDNHWLSLYREGLSKRWGFEKPTENISINGILINIHPKSEPFIFCFNYAGNLIDPRGMVPLTERHTSNTSCSIKTQFAPLDIHICVINLLRYLKKRYIPDLKVYDEGGYWQSEDKELLSERIESINKAMDILEASLSKINWKKGKNHPSKKLADLLEERIKKDFNSN